MSLTTAAEIQACIPNGSTVPSAVVSSLLAAADAAAKTYLGRNIESATYTEHVSAARVGEQMFLNEIPVISIQSANIAQSNAMDVWNAGAVRATVQVVDTGLLFREFVAGAWIETPIPFATYTTLSAMKLAIEAVSGLRWHAELSTEVFGTEPSTDLCELIGPIDIANSKHKTLFLLDGVPVVGWDYPTGSFWFTECGTAENETVVVKYTAGYATVPADVSRGVAMLAAEMYAQSQQSAGAGTKREKLGSYEIELYENATAVLSPSVKALLCRYRRVMV